MKIVVAVDPNYGIGFQDNLLYRLSEDMKFFKELTTNHVVVCGRKTLETFKDGKPLPNRTNIVLSKTNRNVEGVQYANDIAELLKIVKDLENDRQEVFVIGGEMVYKELLEYCDYAYVTKFYEPKPANKHFANIDIMENWEMVNVVKHDMGIDKFTNKEIEYAIIEYKNNIPKPY